MPMELTITYGCIAQNGDVYVEFYCPNCQEFIRVNAGQLGLAHCEHCGAQLSGMTALFLYWTPPQ